MDRRAESNANARVARVVLTFHPVLRANLKDLVGKIKLLFRTYGADVMMPALVEGTPKRCIGEPTLASAWSLQVGGPF